VQNSVKVVKYNGTISKDSAVSSSESAFGRTSTEMVRASISYDFTDVNSTNNSEETNVIFNELGAHPVPYRPIAAERRQSLCCELGLFFNNDCLQSSKVRVMSPKDRPSRVAGIVNDGNCLFRAIAYYLSGSDVEHIKVRQQIVDFEMKHWEQFAALKGWDLDEWMEHMATLLIDNSWGTDIELSAVASMLNVDVWTFYENRWISYRPRFQVLDGYVISIPVSDYRIGDNEGIYLLNERNHFMPVLLPSVRTCLSIISDIFKEVFSEPSYYFIKK
ncbi:unnamed protein product, partial [Thelazia callipaeda]|uniref:OTU domain-containing protein n=1 Tax=Thelazia callipaeda TaxID=103827 RepID=A0A0N5CW17_THECL